MECEYLEGCAFFNKYKESLGPAYDSFVIIYCRGSKLEECRRRQYRLEHGKPPAEDMLPSGATFHPDV
jgi:hypothetical protein